MVALTARLYLGGAGTPVRYFAWGQAVRRAVLAVLLVHALQRLNALVLIAWSRHPASWLRHGPVRQSSASVAGPAGYGQLRRSPAGGRGGLSRSETSTARPRARINSARNNCARISPARIAPAERGLEAGMRRSGQDREHGARGGSADGCPGNAVGTDPRRPGIRRRGPRVRHGLLQAAARGAGQARGRPRRGGPASPVVVRPAGLRSLLRPGRELRAAGRRRAEPAPPGGGRAVPRVGHRRAGQDH